MIKPPFLSPTKLLKLSTITLQTLCTVHLFNEHILEIRPCLGASMFPTLNFEGDFILHSRLFLPGGLAGGGGTGGLVLGSLVTVISPLDPTHQVLKRITGLPNQTILIDPSGERSRTELGLNRDKSDHEWVKVKEGHVWLSGDNVYNSIDSRDYGQVPMGLIKGLVLARVWPDPKWLTPDTVVVNNGSSKEI